MLRPPEWCFIYVFNSYENDKIGNKLVTLEHVDLSVW